MVSLKIAATLTALSIATLSSAGTPQIQICKDEGFNNCLEDWGPEADKCTNLNDEWNDQISSLKNQNDEYICIFYQHGDCEGLYYSGGNADSLKESEYFSPDMDKTFSSVRCSIYE